MHLCCKLGERCDSPFDHRVKSGSPFNISRCEVNGVVGLKHILDKIDFSAIKHVMKVAKDECLLGRGLVCYSRLSDRAERPTNKGEAQHE